MKANRKKLAVLVAVVVLGVALLSVPSGFAAGGHKVECDLETLKGQYLVAVSGMVFPPAFGVTAPSVSAAAAYSVYNGDGTGEDHITFTVNGNVVVPSATEPFVYTLNSDCTGTRTVSPSSPQPGPHFDIFVAADGSALTEIATDPGFSVASFDKRVGH